MFGRFGEFPKLTSSFFTFLRNILPGGTYYIHFVLLGLHALLFFPRSETTERVCEAPGEAADLEETDATRDQRDGASCSGQPGG